ncbi:hypothetical protein FQZ97_1268080 [compost metagenome]
MIDGPALPGTIRLIHLAQVLIGQHAQVTQHLQQAKSGQPRVHGLNRGIKGLELIQQAITHADEDAPLRIGAHLLAHVTP